MVSYVKIDVSDSVMREMTIPLTSNERPLNPQNITFSRHMLRSMFAEIASAHDQLMAKGSGWSIDGILSCRLKMVSTLPNAYIPIHD